jgi:outer membrane protein
MKNLLFGIVAFFSVSAVAQTQPAVEKVGYIDVAYVISQLPEAKAMEGRLVEMRSKLAQDFVVKQADYKKTYEDYAGRYDLMNDSAKSLAGAHINQLQAELQGFEGDAQKTLENTRKLYMAPIYLKIGRAIAEVAVENGYAILIPSGIENTDFVVWGDPRVDASELLIKKMTTSPAPQQTPAKPSTDKKKN